MNELVNKISSYNLFNYLFPGAVFAHLTSEITKFDLIAEDIIVGVFFYYFIGLIISRFGSLAIEPFFRASGFVRFAEYSDYLKAEEKDKKLEILSEANNMYRTLLSMCLLLVLFDIYELLEDIFASGINSISPQPIQQMAWPFSWREQTIILLLCLVFAYAYRKQTSYIRERVYACLQEVG